LRTGRHQHLPHLRGARGDRRIPLWHRRTSGIHSRLLRRHTLEENRGSTSDRSGTMHGRSGRHLGLAVGIAALFASSGAFAQTHGPNGEPPTPTSEIKLSDDEVAELKGGNYTAALLWHTSSDFVNAVTAGATDEFKRLGISIVATTDAGFDAAKQKSDIETVLAKKPSVILALPLDPTTSAEAFRPAVEAGTKIVLLSNTPAGYKQGKDFVAVVTDDLFAMGK